MNNATTTIETNSRTKQLAAKVIYEAFTILKKAGGQLPGREVVNQIEKNLTFTLWETARYEKSGYIRWQSILHFYTIDAIKAGFLRKQKGIWILTTEGEEAMQLGQIGLLDKANEAYKVWKEKNKDTELEVEQKDIPVNVHSQKANLELIQEQALSGLREYIKKLNPYEFQDLVAALLHGMGYYISFVAPSSLSERRQTAVFSPTWAAWLAYEAFLCPTWWPKWG